MENSGDESQTVIGSSSQAQFGYQRLIDELRAEGLFESMTPAYLAMFLLFITIAVSMPVVFLTVSRNSWSILLALPLAFAVVQMGFLAHDAGHWQFSPQKSMNRFILLISANMILGVSGSWWTEKHNRHHRFVNDESRDPDMASRTLIYSADQAKVRMRSKSGRFVARYQSIYVIPILTLEIVQLRATSLVWLLRTRVRHKYLELFLILLNISYFTAVPLLVVDKEHGVVFVILSTTLTGLYLGLAFIVNHIGLPSRVSGEISDFERSQVEHSRNLSTGRVGALIFGGLDSQIEHHLCPSMPRLHLHEARVVVKRHCDELGINYREQTPINAYVNILRFLSQVGKDPALFVEERP